MELECLVRGVGSIGVWFRLNETTNTYIELDGTSSKYTLSQSGDYFYLSFSSASSADSGVYRCEGVSSTGRVNEDFEFLTLFSPSSTLIKGGTDGKFIGLTGNDLSLICESQVASEI